MSVRDDVNGHRGAFLALFGLIYIAYGAAGLMAAEPGAVIRQTMEWMPVWSPLWVCGVLWAAAGLVACVCAFLPIPRDRFGYQATAAVSAAWTVAHLIAWCTGHSSRGWAGALIFLALSAAILVVSGMPNPVKRANR